MVEEAAAAVGSAEVAADLVGVEEAVADFAVDAVAATEATEGLTKGHRSR